MNRSSLIFLLIAALLIGGLVGLQFSAEQKSSNARTLNENEGNEGITGTRVVREQSADDELAYRLIDPKDYPVEQDEFGRPIPAIVSENFSPSNRAFKHQTLAVELGLDGEVEYKIEMQQSDSIVYRWRVNDGTVYYDFHAHPTLEETEFFTRYIEGEGSEHAGSIIAAYEGQHGWFWLNISDKPIVIELEVAGFYDQIVKIPLQE